MFKNKAVRASNRRKRSRHSSLRSASKIQMQGEHYDLKAIYDMLNQDYFKNKLNVEITWFGSANRKARRHRKLGLFCFKTNRIKIHRLLDQPHFPPYFISYVVYHEMLHSVCPPVKAKRGRYRIHHPDFKMREQEFADYAMAKKWEEKNKKLFFYNSSEKNYPLRWFFVEKK
jgi:predicted metal-dependent hydrolase